MFRFVSKTVFFTAVALFAVNMAGCAGSKSLKKNNGKAQEAFTAYPEDIQKLFDKKYEKSIKSVGIASHPDQTVALEKASLDADAKIGAQFKSEISQLQKSFLEAVNDQKLEEFRKTVENFSTITINGVTIVKEMVSEGKDGYSGYVLKVVSAETMKNMIDERTNTLTNFKALQAYKELEDRVAKEKEAQKAADSLEQ